MPRQRRTTIRRGEEAERRHQEEIRRHEHEEDIAWARKNRNVAVVAVTVAAIGILAGALTAWHPWSSTPALRARVTLQNPDVNAVVPKSISQVPPPPIINGKLAGCRTWWNKWYPSQDAAPSEASHYIQISAPASADVTVTAATVHVFRSFVPAALTNITCSAGAGTIPGTLLNVNLSDPAAAPTIVSDTGQDVPLLSMPSAVININPGHTEVVNVSPQGRRLFFEWSVTLTAVVDQKTETFTFGTARHPLESWLGPGPLRDYLYSAQAHSWQPLGKAGSPGG